MVSAGVFGMTMTELIFLGHWNKTIQFLPFALCALGLFFLAATYLRPGKASLAGMRWSMIVIGLCSFIGVYEHMAGNYHFWLEVQPGATVWALVKATLEGENPVLAPGILLLGAAIGLASLYRHPLLEPNHQKEKIE
jgi:membrane-bound ClpP family serine protease